MHLIYSHIVIWLDEFMNRFRFQKSVETGTRNNTLSEKDTGKMFKGSQEKVLEKLKF